MRAMRVALAAGSLLAACSSTTPAPPMDAGWDAGAIDAGLMDAGPVDAGPEPVDAGPIDGGSGDAGFVDAGLIDGVDAGPCETGSCGDVVVGGPIIDEVDVATGPPPARGGPLVSGVYDLTQLILYTGAGGAAGPDGTTKQETIQLTLDASGTGSVIIAEVESGCTKLEALTATLQLDQIQVLQSCPSCTSQCFEALIPYSASGSTFTLFLPAAAGTTQALTLTLE